MVNNESSEGLIGSHSMLLAFSLLLSKLQIYVVRVPFHAFHFTCNLGSQNHLRLH